ncbi:MAG: branched-chain amino acid ABC transporter permease [Clostridiales Family XIII bacterium]|jgi:branched-chain amino acid transport system permease protein|nr:branched-chain amino acid ABC transporter permease [Clostridiales Family XIII bacterium]
MMIMMTETINTINKKKSRATRNFILTIILIAVGILVPMLLNDAIDSYTRRILNLCAIYAIVALSMNLVNGFCGLFSLGQAGFMAIGAYSVAIFTVPTELRPDIFYIEPMNPFLANIEMPFPVAMLLGGVLAAVFAFIIGFPVLRLKGDYLAIATLGFSEIIRVVFTNTQTITNGSLGIKNIPTLSNMTTIYIVLIIVIIILALLLSSSYGRAIKAIREDEIVAESLGISLFKHKMIAFVGSGFFAGIGGGLYAAFLGTVDPKNFMFILTFNFLLIIVMGGLGSLTGTVIASFIVTYGLEVMRFFDEPLVLGGYEIALFKPGLRMVLFSVLLMVIVIFWQRGLLGKTELTWNRMFGWPGKIKGRFTKKKPDNEAVSLEKTEGGER